MCARGGVGGGQFMKSDAEWVTGAGRASVSSDSFASFRDLHSHRLPASAHPPPHFLPMAEPPRMCVCVLLFSFSFPPEILRIIQLDLDLKYKTNIRELFEEFDNFLPGAVIGIAREMQPVYR